MRRRLLGAQARAGQRRRLRRAGGGRGGLPGAGPGVARRRRGTGADRARTRRVAGRLRGGAALRAGGAAALPSRTRRPGGTGGTGGPGGTGDPLPAAGTVTVWRCPDCGSVDAPQECIGVCIWHPAEWVEATAYEAERLRAAADLDTERALAGLLRTLAYVTPRAGHWEQSWRALQAEARRAGARLTGAALGSHGGRASPGREACGEPSGQPDDGGINERGGVVKVDVVGGVQPPELLVGRLRSLVGAVGIFR